MMDESGTEVTTPRRADERPFIKVSDTLADHPKFIALDDDAAGFMVVAIWGYCRHQNTDGFIPKAKAHRITKSANQKRCEKAVRVGLLEDAGESYLCHDYLDHQQSAAQREAVSLKRSAAGRAGGLAKAKATAKQDAKQSASGLPSKSVAEVEVEVEEEKNAAAPLSAVADEPRSDVEGLCSYFIAALARNDVKATVTQKWRTEARLLLDKDAKAPAEIKAVIDWATGNDFWRANILSVPKLREKYDQLRLQMTAGRPRLVEGDNREYLREWQ